MPRPAATCWNGIEMTCGAWLRPDSITAWLAPIDPSDVVQEALTEAAQRMDEFLRDRPLPLLGWLRQLAGERVIQTHRHHLFAQRRSVARESLALEIPDASAVELVSWLTARTPARAIT